MWGAALVKTTHDRQACRLICTFCHEIKHESVCTAVQHAGSDWLSTLLVFHRGEDDSSSVALAFGLNTSKDLIMNNSANTAAVAAEPDRIST